MSMILILRPLEWFGIVVAELKRVASLGQFMMAEGTIRSEQVDIEQANLHDLAVLCEQLRPASLYARYANKMVFRHEEDFWATTEKAVKTYVKQMADMRIIKAVGLADKQDIPIIYVKDKETPLHISNRLKTERSTKVTPVMNFYRHKEGTTYRLQLRIGEKLVERPSEHHPVVLTHTPGLFVLNNSIYELCEGFSGQLLLPFAEKENVEIPLKMENDYFRRFILKHVARNGQRYQVAEIRRGALFAQESGTLNIEPLDLNVLAMVQRQRKRTGSIWDLFDDPFFNSAQSVERPLRTKRLSVNVRPLPAGPDDFSGAVGNFDVKGGLTTHDVKANEAITYRLTVSGNGNLMLINAPQPEFPSVFEVYDPQIDDNLKKGDGGISGSRTFEWVLIPRSQGSYTIPAFNFVYFDPATGHYVTKHVEAQEIEVAKGSAQSLALTSSKDDVRLLNSDINYIIPTGRVQPIKRTEHAGWPFFIVLLAIVAAAVGAIVGGRIQQSKSQDVAGMRMKRATRMARKRLKKAAAFLGSGDSNRFYEEIYKAIWGCLADKYNIELSQLNRDSVNACLNDKQVPADQQAQIMKVLQDVDLARFAPGNADAQKQSVYNEALMMIAGL